MADPQGTGSQAKSEEKEKPEVKTEEKPRTTGSDSIDKLPPEVKEYVIELREENKRRRLENKELTAERDVYKTKIDEIEKKTLEEQGKYKELSDQLRSELTTKEKKWMERVARESLRAHAAAAGLIDPDLADIIPIDKVQINELGQTLNASQIVADYKQTKPHLFKDWKVKPETAEKPSLSTKPTGSEKPTVPPTTDMSALDVRKMNTKEYNDWKKGELARLRTMRGQ